jgi:uncharacterized protein YndB with AHSA1/START domain
MTDGILLTVDGRSVLRFERRLRHPPDRVWPALCDPDELSHWFPARIEVDGELRRGAPLRFVFPGGEGPTLDGEVTHFDPPRILQYTWGDSVLRFELRPEGEGSVLVFTHAFDPPAEAAKFAAGWHLCLDALGAQLDGAPAPPAEVWGEHHERYARAFAGGEEEGRR